MSILVIQLPQRPRLRAKGSAEPFSNAGQVEYSYVLSSDGLAIDAQGACAAALLPKAALVVATLADADVGWHRITLPKAPTARLRAALVGVLEEALLEDTEAVHLALAPQAAAGQPAWVAAVNRPWLRGELANLQRARVFVDRVVPMSWPDDPPAGHFASARTADGAAAEEIALTWADADGVAHLSLQGGLARALLPNPAPAATRWSATPGAAVAAEAWLGAPVSMMSPAQRLLQAARSLWNLRQFDLAPRTRGARAMRDSWRQFLSPGWRPVRIGVALLLLAQVGGLNLWAWHQRSEIAARQQALQNLVKAAYPRVNALDVQRDAAAVMQRETEALRSSAGKPGKLDLEPMLQATAAAWPDGRPPAESLRFEPGKLSVAGAGWTDTQIEHFRSLLRPGGWQVDAAEGRITLSRARPGADS